MPAGFTVVLSWRGEKEEGVNGQVFFFCELIFFFVNWQVFFFCELAGIFFLSLNTEGSIFYFMIHLSHVLNFFLKKKF